MNRISQIILLILTCAAASNVAAQVSLFDKMYDQGGWENALSIYENEDSTIIALFSTIDFTAEDSTSYKRLYCSKLNSKGEIIKTIWLTPLETEFLGSREIERIGEELFFVATFRKTDTTERSSPFVSKGFYLNTNGDTLRTFTIVHPILDTVNPGWRVPTHTNDGKFITSQLYRNYIGRPMFVFLNDSAGNLIWIKEFKDLLIDVTSIKQTPDRGYLLSGYEFEKSVYIRDSNGWLVYAGHPERLWYAKLDSMGNMVYQRKFTGWDYEFYDTIYYSGPIDQKNEFWDAIAVSDGNYIMAGSLARNPYMVKVDNNGTQLWERKYFSKFHFKDSLGRMAFFMNIREVKGALYALGYYDSLEQGAKRPTGYFFLMKLTLSGKVEWIRYYNGERVNYFYRSTPGKDGFFLTGSKIDTVPKNGYQDGWIVKVNQFGCLQPGCDSLDILDTITSLKEPIRVSLLSNVFPNPGSGVFSITGLSGNGEIVSVYDVNGRMVFKENNITRVDIRNQPAGVYLLQIRDAQGLLLSNHKLILSSGQ